MNPIELLTSLLKDCRRIGMETEAMNGDCAALPAKLCVYQVYEYLLDIATTDELDELRTQGLAPPFWRREDLAALKEDIRIKESSTVALFGLKVDREEENEL